jgi:hypothetical protein
MLDSSIKEVGMKYDDKGDEIREMQKSLVAQGYPLPKYRADGHLGEESWDTLHRYADDHGIPWRPEVPQEVLDDLDVDDPLVIIPTTKPPALGDVKLYDLRGEQTNPPAKANKFRLSAGKVVERNPAMVTGITIHQTAVKYSAAQYQIDAAGGDRELALARRSMDVACHVMAFHDGFIAWPNPLEWYAYHGNSFNSFELGIEIDGNYPGLIGGETWNGKAATPVTDASIKAARAGIELLVQEGRALGMPIEYLHAHRQCSSSRRSDPGEELWRRVVLEFCVPVLGLKLEQGRTWKEGRPIPVGWDPAGVGAY